MSTEEKRCAWCLKDDIYKNYHDTQWGKPVTGDQELFEKLLLDGAQAGLSWYTILVKTENYRKAFDNFDAEKMSMYTPDKVEELMLNKGIVRNRLKINAFIQNARAYLKLKKEHGSFAAYLWQFVGNRQIISTYKHISELPAQTPESEAMSKALKKAGFKFVGPTICYAFMQATGMVDDHLEQCPSKAKEPFVFEKNSPTFA
ncbi:MAG: DNA-3-methyladenine glycosylase I [Cytophagales bacterium]|nr:DNA-3-methyladenine glycosylase I [Cytophagales bacterium]